jgi:hypothetical protein
MSIRSQRRIENGVKRISGAKPALCRGNRKGCDIGYGPSASSCEGANSVDACTVAALDAITALAVPNPNCFSQSQSVFSGLVARSGRPAEQITQPTSDWQI